MVLNTCPHAFCKRCIEDMNMSRNRKCPLCGVKFGKTDIHEIILSWFKSLWFWTFWIYIYVFVYMNFYIYDDLFLLYFIQSFKNFKKINGKSI